MAVVLPGVNGELPYLGSHKAIVQVGYITQCQSLRDLHSRGPSPRDVYLLQYCNTLM